MKFSDRAPWGARAIHTARRARLLRIGSLARQALAARPQQWCDTVILASRRAMCKNP